MYLAHVTIRKDSQKIHKKLRSNTLAHAVAISLQRSYIYVDTATGTVVARSDRELL